MNGEPKKKRSRAEGIATVIPFNPLEKKVLGAAIAEVLITTPVYPLSVPLPRRGAGIYAIYYSGDFPAYSDLAEQNKSGRSLWPIYVGQALPSGGRRGIEVEDDGIELRGRLMKHHRSIKAASDLKLEDFHYRALVMDDAFIRLGETSLLALYKPIWNNYVDGFGNNQPGKMRESSKKSRWDTLHGGRAQAAQHTQSGESRESIIAEISQVLISTNFDLPGTLLTAVWQSETMAPEMNFGTAVNTDEVVLDKPTGS